MFKSMPFWLSVWHSDSMADCQVARMTDCTGARLFIGLTTFLLPCPMGCLYVQLCDWLFKGHTVKLSDCLSNGQSFWESIYECLVARLSNNLTDCWLSVNYPVGLTCCLVVRLNIYLTDCFTIHLMTLWNLDWLSHFLTLWLTVKQPFYWVKKLSEWLSSYQTW